MAQNEEKIMTEPGTKVVVTTDMNRRGVFFGVLKSHDGNGRVVLSEARNCVYWSASTHGFIGLAAKGPQNGSRVSPSVPELELDGVTSISTCTESAAAAWEAEPWSE